MLLRLDEVFFKSNIALCSHVYSFSRSKLHQIRKTNDVLKL